MQIQQTRKPTSLAPETFYDCLQRTLNYAGSRPPKLELTGILVPTYKRADWLHPSFNLETKQSEFLLRMDDSVLAVAKRLEWEEVTVKGQLVSGTDIFEVDKIFLSNRNEPYRLPSNPSYFDYFAS